MKKYKEEVENKEVEKEPIFKVKKPEKYIITVPNLALRDAPNGKEIGVAIPGHTLISEIRDGFGKLADDSGWVMMKYLRKAE